MEIDPPPSSSSSSTSTTTTTTSAASEKILGKLKSSIEGGDLYSALQIFRTQHARAKKRGDFQQGMELAHGGAMLMLERGEINSAGELARDFLQVCKDEGGPLAEDKIKKIAELDAAFAKHTTEEAVREKKRFLKSAIEYSAEAGDYQHGDPSLHRAAAMAAMKEHDWPGAAKHMLHSHRPDELASLLVRWSGLGPETERDLYAVRAVLQLLCLENLRDANVVYETFRTQLPKVDTPLLRFVGFLLKTLERDALPLFQTLRQRYAPSIARGRDWNPSIDAYLDKIALVFYGVQPQKTGMAAIMQNMLGLF